MAPEPLTPEQVDALLRPDPRTAAADLRVLRDALHRMADAWERVARAAGMLGDAAAGGTTPSADRPADLPVDAPRPPGPRPPRAD